MITPKCPRFESIVPALEWLRDNVPNHAEFYELAIQIVNSPVLRGIPVFTKELKDRLDKLTVVPIWMGDHIFEVPVKPYLLYWVVEDQELEELYEELELDFEIDEYYAATAFLNLVIDLNFSATYLFSATTPKSFKTILKIVDERIRELQASLIKEAADIIATRYDILAIRGRHITLDPKFRNFLVPRGKLSEILSKPQLVKHVIVVEGNIAYAYNPDKAIELLHKIGLTNVTKVIKTSFSKIADKLQVTEQDTVISHLFRHPIIGYVGIGTVQEADIYGIGVPADISQKLDGDDDGDIIDLIPSVIVKNQKLEFVTTILDI